MKNIGKVTKISGNFMTNSKQLHLNQTEWKLGGIIIDNGTQYQEYQSAYPDVTVSLEVEHLIDIS